MIFDRRHDVSKLYGCNTRNVQYRWNLFAARIEELRKQFDAPHALDFGAGSLRDSYELARLGFSVTSVDLDPKLMQRYYQSYDWSTARYPAGGRDVRPHFRALLLPARRRPGVRRRPGHRTSVVAPQRPAIAAVDVQRVNLPAAVRLGAKSDPAIGQPGWHGNSVECGRWPEAAHHGQ